MKIYTKLGDKGETSLIGGKRVLKSHPRIEAYGTVDELISFIAVIRDSEISSILKNTLLEVQHKLMDCAAILAADPDLTGLSLPKIYLTDIEQLENEIDKIDKTLPVLKSFIIPGGDIASSYCHLARTVCRRAERIIISLLETETIEENLIKYVNRLSDYLFVLSRKILYDKGVHEILWKK